MRGRTTAAAGAVALLVLVGVLSGCAPDTSGRITTTVDIGCGEGTQVAPVDWYLPPAGMRPRALVWLQHGFVESKDDWRGLAPAVAAQGAVVVAPSLPTFDPSGCNVENLGDNRAYLDHLATLFAGIDEPDSALARSYGSARALAGLHDEHDEHDGGDGDARDHRARLPHRLVVVGHSAGGETVLGVAERLRVNHPDTFASLGGIVLEDPVNSFLGSTFAEALDGLGPTAVPILTLASPPGACNAFQSGIVLIEQRLAARPFRGAQVTTGTHGDVFGSAVMPLEALACGQPQPADVDAVRTLTLGWISDAADGARRRTWYPGGAAYDALVAAGTISTLP